MAWKQKINARSFVTASALALCLTVGSNTYAADISVNAEFNAGSSMQAQYDESATEARSRNEANADMHTESGASSTNAEAAAQSESSTSARVNNRDDRDESANRSADSDETGDDRSKRSANGTGSLSSENDVTAMADYASNSVTQGIAAVSHTAISNGSQASVSAITETQNVANAALHAMPESETNAGANQVFEPPSTEGLQFAGRTDLVGQVTTA
ncbi:MAG: hypothetical protein RIA65_17480, partial [Woeseia sp.]